MRYILTIILQFLLAFGFAQHGSSYKKVYRQALQSADSITAVFALNCLVAEFPKSTYRDTLAFLYFKTNRPAQAVYWIDNVLEDTPKNAIWLKELKATCLSISGNTPAFAAAMLSLVKEDTTNTLYLYRLADAQFDLQEDTQVIATLSKIEKLPVDTVRRIPYRPGNNNMVSYTGISATAANMKGMIFYKRQEYTKAKEAFKKAIGLDKTYISPQLNLAQIENDEAAAALKKNKSTE